MEQIESIYKKVEVNLSSLKDATNRSRNAFIFLNLTALIIFISLFNQEFSWQQNITNLKRPYATYVRTVGIDSSDASFDQLRKHYADMYFERQFFTVPLLGIKCSGSDLTVYAPLATIIFITWFFFALRRENHIIGEVKCDFDKIIGKINLIEESKNNDKTDLNNWKILLNNLYTGCMHSFLLITATSHDFIKTNQTFGKNFIARPVIIFLQWVPLLILLFILYTDIRDFIEKPFMKQHLYEFLKIDTFLLIISGFVVYQIVIMEKITNQTKIVLKEMFQSISKYDYSLE